MTTMNVNLNEVIAEGRQMPYQAVKLGQLLLAFLWIGSISFGGKSASFIFDELSQRRRWVTEDDYAEAHTLAKLLPGPTGLATAIFLVKRLGRSSAVTLLCLVPYLVPGLALILVLSVFALGLELPAWAQGGLNGLALAATALLMTTALRMVPSMRRARFGMAFAIAAFLGTCLLRLDLTLILLVLVPLAMLSNHSRRR